MKCYLCGRGGAECMLGWDAWHAKCLSECIRRGDAHECIHCARPLGRARHVCGCAGGFRGYGQ